jgi:hypothetical protein
MVSIPYVYKYKNVVLVGFLTKYENRLDIPSNLYPSSTTISSN